MGLLAGLPALRFDRLDGKERATSCSAIQVAFGRDEVPLSAVFVSERSATVPISSSQRGGGDAEGLR